MDIYKKKTGIRISFTKNKVLFGMIEDKISKSINWLIINVKYDIYSMKIGKRNVCIDTIKLLGKIFQIEKYIYIYYKHFEYDKFNIEWSKWFNLLKKKEYQKQLYSHLIM